MPKNAAGKAPAEPDVSATFQKESIIENAALFETAPEIMAGALSSLSKDKITKTEASEAVKEFLSRPVERGN